MRILKKIFRFKAGDAFPVREGVFYWNWKFLIYLILDVL